MVRIAASLCFLSVGGALRRHAKSEGAAGREGMLGSDASSYVDQATSAEKLRYYWDQIVADQTPKGYMSKFSTVRKVLDTDFLWSMQNYTGGLVNPSDTRRKEHHKMTHGPGGVAKVHFEWKPNRYTGMFQKADNCVIRIANAAEPSEGGLFGVGKTSFNPNMAIKCYRDGGEEDGVGSDANLLTIWEIDGFDHLPHGAAESCNFFEVPLSNHAGDRDNISMTLKSTFLNAFRKVTDQPLMLGTSLFAEGTQEGGAVEKPDFPFALVFKPNPRLASIKCDFKDFMAQLRRAGEQLQGQMLYEVYAVHDPWYSRPRGQPEIQHLGSMVLDDGFSSSQFGDSELFFRHRFMETELQVLKKVNASREQGWRSYVHPSSPFVKEEGAAWYRRYLP